jgi:hypothetical protein
MLNSIFVMSKINGISSEVDFHHLAITQIVHRFSSGKWITTYLRRISAV